MRPEDFGPVRNENDRFRSSCQHIDENVLWDPALVLQGSTFRVSVLRLIREQQDFEYDVVDLHDYGALVVEGQSIEWMILYLDEHSSTVDPAEATCRALSIEPGAA